MTPEGFEHLRCRSRTKIPAAALGTRSAHPDVVEVVHERFGLLRSLEEERHLEIPLHVPFRANARTREVGASHQSHRAVHDEDLGVHPYTVKELDSRTELTLRVELLISSAEGSRRQLRMNHPERYSPVHEHCHKVHKGHKAPLEKKSRALDIRRGNPDETSSLGQVGKGESVVNLSVHQGSHIHRVGTNPREG